MLLYIVGAGGFGREVLCYARDVGRDVTTGTPLTVAGFLDDHRGALDGHAVGATVVGGVADAPIGPDAAFVIAIGDPRVRWKLAGALAARGARFATIVHPTAYVAPGARLGAGAIIGPFAFVSDNVTVGSHTIFNTYCSAGHDATLGRCVVMSPYAVVNGNTTVGDGAFFGTHATLVLGKRLGAWAKLGAGAVALADIADGTLAVGVPAAGAIKYAAPIEPGPPA
jgi:sugar O-acyltransferase (sialic acid O-acetyltransferase NeuD family)